MSSANLRRVVAVSAVAAVLAGCASHGASVSGPSVSPPLPSAAARDDAALRHFLDRLTFGSTPRELAAVEAIGARAYLERQMQPDRIDDQAMDRRLAAFETLTLPSREIADRYERPAVEARRARQLAEGKAVTTGTTAAATPAAAVPGIDRETLRRERLVLQELSAQKLLRAVYSERQFQEVLVDFWFNHFNVFAGKGADRALVTAYERDVIRPHVFGTFRELLGATAASPAMLFYLDNWMSVDPDGPHPLRANSPRLRARLRPPFAPPARTQPASGRKPRRGVNENYARELMELHTLGVDGGYTQHDVTEVARCFTGWTIAQPRDGGDFRFDERLHDPGAKVVLGRRIKPGGGKDDGETVLDILAAHPSTARFIATKLVRRFVADAPPPSLVDRVAKRFSQTGGNLREVYRTIFTSPEFWSADARAAKVKSPFEFVVSALRSTDAGIDDATAAVQAVRTLGMPLYGCPTPNGYADTADAWINAGAVLSRMNVALALAGGRMPGVHVDLAALGGTTDVAAARPRLLTALLGNRASPATQASIDRATTLPQVGALLLGSPDFQRR